MTSDDLPRQEKLDTDDIRRIDATDYKNKDWFLMHLVNMVEVGSGDLSFGITLFVGGTQIAGDLVSGRVYFDALASHMGSVNSANRTAELISTVVRRLGSAVYGDVGEFVDAENQTEAAPDPLGRRFIHLLNAAVLHPTINSPSGGGQAWRGKIASVDGFIMGRLSYTFEN